MFKQRTVKYCVSTSATPLTYSSSCSNAELKYTVTCRHASDTQCHARRDGQQTTHSECHVHFTPSTGTVHKSLSTTHVQKHRREQSPESKRTAREKNRLAMIERQRRTDPY